jgi:hypothetical protein
MSLTDTTLPKSLLRALLLVAAFAGLQTASGCGKVVSSEDTGSETHWLVRCDSDAECGPGNCACGVCTLACNEDADCSALGVRGMRCSLPMTCAAEPEFKTADGGCFVPCQSNADCAGLASDASCERGRCELPPGVVLGAGASIVESGGGGSSAAENEGSGGTEAGSGGASAGEIATLCDGSDDVRLVSRGGGGFVDQYYAFAATYGLGFYAVDGRCRYWRGVNDGRVFAGTLDPEQAQSFAENLGFGTFSHIRYTEEPDCDDGGARTIRSFEGTIVCVCGCTDAPPAFLAALAADSKARGELFAGGEPLTGPLQLLLLETEAPTTVEYAPVPWPLERAPTAAEIVSWLNSYAAINESSGALIIDAAESTTLRATRDAFISNVRSFDGSIPIVLPGDAGQTSRYFRMLLRDEVPAPVKAALLGGL